MQRAGIPARQGLGRFLTLETALDLSFALAIAVLFWGIRWQTPIGLLRLFEPFVIICGLLMVLMYRRQALYVPQVLSLHLLYLAWSVVSAFTVDTLNGVREGLQVFSVLTFVALLCARFRIRQDNQVWFFLAVLLVGLAVYVAAWHASIGFPAGYKHMGQAKTTFLLVPAILAAAIAVWGRRPWVVALVALGLVLVVLSGERKAYICAAAFFAGAVGLSGGRMLFAATLGVAFLAVAVALDPSGYVNRQFESLLQGSVGNQDFYSYSLEVYPESISNAQRQFAWRVGGELFQEHPLFGLGSNAFEAYVWEEYRASMAPYLLNSIHGEFLRVLVENGLIGFIPYCMAWIGAGVQLVRATPPQALREGLRGPPLVRLLVFVACLAFVAFEAASSLTQLAFLVPALLVFLFPDVSRASIAPSPAIVRTRSRWVGGI